MTLSIGNGSGPGSNREALEIHIGQAGGVAAKVLEGWIGVAGDIKQFHGDTSPVTPAFTASASPGHIYWDVVSPGSYYVAHEEAVATASGGTAPYSYAWFASVDYLVSIKNPDSQVTAFDSGYGLSVEVWCVVTDANFNTAETNRVVLD